MVVTRDTPLVLGSGSPRRREMIAMLGVPLVVRPAHVDEGVLPDESPEGYLERVVVAKLEAVFAAHRGTDAGALVADTVVVAPGGSILGKPRDDQDARRMLERLAGATHEVSTRFALGSVREVRPAHVETVTTRVTFRPIAPDEVASYVATGEGRDKAGGYAVQGLAATFVTRIEGSYTNVVGLPLCEVVVAMRALGWLGLARQ